MISQLSSLVAVFCVTCLAGQSSDDSKLDPTVRAETAGFPGKISIYAKNLDNGRTYSLAGEQPVRTASTIKLAIMTECFAEAAEGKLDMAERIKLTDAEKVSGSGILQDLSSGDELPVRDMIDLMIVLSDNTATNLILTRIGGNAVNSRMASLGLTQTRVMRKILGDRNQLKPYPEGVTDEGAKPENKRWGIGRSSPKEMVTLLEMIYRGKLVSKPASDEMLAILKRQRDHGSIGRDMKDVTVASKSGALDQLRSDVGIVYSAHGAIAMAITIDDITEPNWTPDNPGELLISKLSELLTSNLGSPDQPLHSN